jgi:hypothetical protein
MDKTDILLTGSVVQYCPALLKEGLWDTGERLLDYLCAIRLWLDHPSVRYVVYCDAGDYKLPEEIFANNRFESLSVNLIDLCVEKGRGAAECESIRYAIEKSRFLEHQFFKCTGRLFVTNFDAIIRATRPEGRFLYLNKSDQLKGADTRFYGIDKEYFLNDVMPTITMMHDYSGEIIEKIFYRHVHQYCFFPLACVMGRSGYNGQRYNAYFSDAMRKEALQISEKMEIPKQY